MADVKPPFTLESATRKVKAAQALWNTRDPSKVVGAYTIDCVWRNRDKFIQGHEEITQFLTQKWEKEQNYILRKELFAFGEDKIAVQFWYEYQGEEGWSRCYGLEHWSFDRDTGKMKERQMSGNDVKLLDSERWFADGAEEVDEAMIGAVPQMGKSI